MLFSAIVERRVRQAFDDTNTVLLAFVDERG